MDNYPDDLRCGNRYKDDPRSPFYEEPWIHCDHCDDYFDPDKYEHCPSCEETCAKCGSVVAREFMEGDICNVCFEGEEDECTAS